MRKAVSFIKNNETAFLISIYITKIVYNSFISLLKAKRLPL